MSRCRRERSSRSTSGFNKLIAKKTEVETIARGFIWTEGTAWNKEGKFLVFSDIPHNVVHKWQDGKISDFVKPSGYTGKSRAAAKPAMNPAPMPPLNVYAREAAHWSLWRGNGHTPMERTSKQFLRQQFKGEEQR